MMGIGMGFGGIGLIFMLLFWGGLIFGGVWLVRSLFSAAPSSPAGPRQPSAREVLDQRYARGEISRDEYERIKRDIA
ncbi:MAG TPA: SHOCT domain-containing protein [Chloroflexi bacterium]|nr:SHOCT domain-containing protein [Chloroflexota bacterium]